MLNVYNPLDWSPDREAMATPAGGYKTVRLGKVVIKADMEVADQEGRVLQTIPCQLSLKDDPAELLNPIALHTAFNTLCDIRSALELERNRPPEPKSLWRRIGDKVKSLSAVYRTKQEIIDRVKRRERIVVPNDSHVKES